jgi:glycosyltransferase involved in cell wall biosynthesis
MRILLIAPMLPSPDGPGAIPMLLHAQLEALTGEHDVTLVVGVGDEPGEQEAAAALRERRDLDVRLVDRRRPQALAGRWRRRWQLGSRWLAGGEPWRTIWFAAPAAQVALDELARSRTFDVVAVEDSSMALFRLPAGVPAVLTEHEVRLPRAPRRPPRAPARWPGWAFAELDWRRWAGFQRAAWRRYDRVQVFTERDAASVRSLAPELADRVKVNPFGMVLPAPADPAREQAGLAVFVGNFTHRPNRDAVAWLVGEIMPLVRRLRPGARLRVVGTSPPPEIRRLAGPDVEVVADAPSTQPHIEAASVFLAPVRIGGGMRMKVLLALASGKAVVTTGRGAEGYAISREHPPLVVRDDAAGIAAATAELLGDDARRAELGARARAYAERHHSPRAWGKRLVSVYEEALAAAGRPEA